MDGSSHRLGRRVAIACVLGGAIAIAQLSMGIRVQAASIATGDVLVSDANSGNVTEYTPSGALVQTLVSGQIQATGSAFDAAGNFYVTNFSANAVTKFDTTGTNVGTFGSGYGANPESIVFNAVGNAFVGQADGSHNVLEFNAAGSPVATFAPATEFRGTDWVELSSDQCTLLYTSEGTLIKAFNVCTNTQLADFASGLPGVAAYELRIRPNGEVLVADSSQVFRLSNTGAVLQAYSIPGSSGNLFALNLDPDGTSFWTADVTPGGVVAKVDIGTGTILQSWNTGGGFLPAGLAIKGEITVGGGGGSCAPPAESSFTGTINEYNTPTLDSLPEGIVCGPDGNLWFTEEGKNRIGKVTASGAITEYNLYPPRNGTTPESITVGPDGALWFVESGINRIGRITTGGTVTDFKVPGTPSLEGITSGPDGNLWFADNNHAIWRMTPSGTTTKFSLASGHGTEGIVAGPDGKLWFTEPGASRIGKITTTGTITEYALASGRGPTWITVGPDGNLWFSETSANKIGKSTTAGAVTEYSIPTASSQPGGIVSGPDGALWFVETESGKIGRITTAGVVTNEYPLDNPHYDGPIGITSGPCGLWVTNEKTSEINNLQFGCLAG